MAKPKVQTVGQTTKDRGDAPAPTPAVEQTSDKPDWRDNPRLGNLKPVEVKFMDPEGTVESTVIALPNEFKTSSIGWMAAGREAMIQGHKVNVTLQLVISKSKIVG